MLIKTTSFWAPIVEKVEKRLMSWGYYSVISKEGCHTHTLIQVTTTNLPIYYLSLYKIATETSEMIERSFHNFLWNESEERSDSHLLNWNKVKLPVEGGLGIIGIIQKCKSLLATWIRCFREEKAALWRQVIALYG